MAILSLRERLGLSLKSTVSRTEGPGEEGVLDAVEAHNLIYRIGTIKSISNARLPL